MVDLEAYVKPDETALQLYARNYVEPFPTGIYFCAAVIPGQILEIAGRSGSGKTTFLLQAALTAILPRLIGDHNFGGLNENVLFIDLDHKFDILRLMEMLHARIQPVLSSLGRDDTELDHIIDECLHRFHLITCSSSFEVLAVLKTLGGVIANLQAGLGTRLLLVDNIAAFYWMDFGIRAPPKDQFEQYPSKLTLQAVHTAASACLQRLSKQLKLAVMVTKHCFKGVSPSDNEEVDHWQLKEMMCKPWIDVVSQRILLKRAINDFKPNMQFLGRWDKPQGHQTYNFAIDDTGLHPWQ